MQKALLWCMCRCHFFGQHNPADPIPIFMSTRALTSVYLTQIVTKKRMTMTLRTLVSLTRLQCPLLTRLSSSIQALAIDRPWPTPSDKGVRRSSKHSPCSASKDIEAYLGTPRHSCQGKQLWTQVLAIIQLTSPKPIKAPALKAKHLFVPSCSNNQSVMSIQQSRKETRS